YRMQASSSAAHWSGSLRQRAPVHRAPLGWVVGPLGELTHLLDTPGRHGATAGQHVGAELSPWNPVRLGDLARARGHLVGRAGGEDRAQLVLHHPADHLRAVAEGGQDQPEAAEADTELVTRPA